MAQHNTHKSTVEGKQQTLERRTRRRDKYRETTIHLGGYSRRLRSSEK